MKESRKQAIKDSGSVKQETSKVSPTIVSRSQATVRGKEHGGASGLIIDHVSIFAHHF